MSGHERALRSRLAQLAHQAGLLRGTLAVRERTCGKPRCKCLEGHKHVSLYLVVSHDGVVRQLFVPKDWEQRVRQWVEQYQEARDRLEQISTLYWDKVKQRQE
jgi:hypothetical protein